MRAYIRIFIRKGGCSILFNDWSGDSALTDKFAIQYAKDLWQL